jgi:hypothetical protein
MSRENIAKSMLALGVKIKLYQRRGFWGRLFHVGIINPKLK